MIEIKDEILNDEPFYRIRDKNGNILFDNLTIEQITPVVQEGTPINKVLFDSIQADLNSKLPISAKATTAEAETGADDTKYMTPLKVLQEINKSALPSKQMSIKTGTISSGSNIPQTSGYNNYMYFVSINSISSTELYGSVSTNTSNSHIKLSCSVNQSTRLVTILIYGYYQYSSHTYSWVNKSSGTANYIEFAWN